MPEGRIGEGDVRDLVRAPLKIVEGKGPCDGVSDKTAVMTTRACAVGVRSCCPERHRSAVGNSNMGKHSFISHSSKASQQFLYLLTSSPSKGARSLDVCME